MVGLYSLLIAAVLPVAASAANFPDGTSTVRRDAAEVGLYVPAATNRLRGSTGLFIFFGGMGDSVEHYQKALAPMADALDLVVLVPHLPWFAEPGRAQPLQIMAALEELRGELEQAFQADAELVVVGGASAGGGAACWVAREWAARVPFLVLHSTRPCPERIGARTLHVVGESETALLGEGGAGERLGEGSTDRFAVPGEGHQVHVRHMRAWLETELARYRVARFGNRTAPLSPLPEDDAFMRYLNDRRTRLTRASGTNGGSNHDTRALLRR